MVWWNLWSDKSASKFTHLIWYSQILDITSPNITLRYTPKSVSVLKLLQQRYKIRIRNQIDSNPLLRKRWRLYIFPSNALRSKMFSKPNGCLFER